MYGILLIFLIKMNEETAILAQEFQELRAKYDEELRGKAKLKSVLAEYEKTIAKLIDGIPSPFFSFFFSPFKINILALFILMFCFEAVISVQHYDFSFFSFSLLPFEVSATLPLLVF
jgi:hypothetical protein